MLTCEYCGHPNQYHIYDRLLGKPRCRVELGDEFMEGYEYKKEFEPNKEKLCNCTKVREVINVS